MELPLLLTLCLAAAGAPLAGSTAFAQEAASSRITLEFLPGEGWWGGADSLGHLMQFSVAPWRVLDAAHLNAVKKAVALRMRFTPRIVELARACAVSGEPILRPLAYVFPDGGYEHVKDEFMMGDDVLVAPMVTRGTSRTVLLPPGSWKTDNGSVIAGPAQKTFEVPIDRLLYFERQ